MKKAHIKQKLLPVALALLSLCILASCAALWETEAVPPAEGTAEFHFIDVGQGDAVLIKAPDGNVLVDAGKNSTEEELKAYLDSVGVSTIKYAIFTHPHEDHIGGADMVVEKYDIENVILPAKTSTTKTYMNMLTALSERNVNTIQAVSGEKYFVGDLVLNVLGPVRDDYGDTNDHSVVILAEWGDTRVMLAGDAETAAEEDILAKFGNSNIDCNILKLGHHGSSTSSSEAWLSAIDPDIGIICCGKDNEYGHPHAEIVERLSKHGVASYRTDLLGDIVFVSDGKTFTQQDN